MVRPSIDPFLDRFDQDILCISGASRAFDFQAAILTKGSFRLVQGDFPRDDLESLPAFAVVVHDPNVRSRWPPFQAYECPNPKKPTGRALMTQRARAQIRAPATDRGRKSQPFRRTPIGRSRASLRAKLRDAAYEVQRREFLY
jgi:hypothetical protein